MARQDRTQGFGFVYVDIAKLLKEARGDKAPQMEPQPKKSVLVKRELHAVPSPKPVGNETNALVDQNRDKAIKQIKENLDRLQSLHHKLHAMLEELNKITDPKKR